MRDAWAGSDHSAAANEGRATVMTTEHAWLVVCVCALPALASCSLGQLALGQLELINGQVRLDRAINDERDPERRALLREAPAVLRFAEEVVGLRPGRSYAGYFATEREGMTYVLTASERYRFAAYSWWFPVAGTVQYRSYHDENDARSAARALERRGYDTWVAPSKAYSTLGYFRDPITTTMMRDGLVGFVEVLLHELAHAQLYVPGRTEWNEALASFVGETGAEQYFARSRFASGPWREQMHARATRRRESDRLVAAAVDALERVYAGGRSRATMQVQRTKIFSSLSQALVRVFPQEDPAQLRMNNARVLHLRRYRAAGAEMLSLWRASGERWRGFWQLASLRAQSAP